VDASRRQLLGNIFWVVFSEIQTIVAHLASHDPAIKILAAKRGRGVRGKLESQ
jgi:hypothetical protein